jgi:hypothetical protein
MLHTATANPVRMEGDEDVTLPTGRSIPDLPMLTAMLRGLQGIVGIVGVTGVGKSSLAGQIAASVAAPDFPVVYADFEMHLGPRKSIASIRMRRMFPALDPEVMVTVQTYEDAIENLNLQTMPSLLVLDTLHKSVKFTEGADGSEVTAAIAGRMKELEGVVARGHTVLFTSQLGRSGYTGRPALGSAMWSSSIEHTAWNLLGYWKPAQKGNELRHLAYSKPPRLAPDDPRMATAMLPLISGQFDKVTEGPLMGLGGGSNGNHAPEARVRKAKLTPLHKALGKHGPLTYSELVKTKCGSEASVTRWIKRAMKAGEIALDKDTRKYAQIDVHDECKV